MSTLTAGPAANTVGPTSGLTVFFDPGCALCPRCRVWLEAEPTWVPVRFVAADAAAGRNLVGDLPWLGTELVVVSDEGAAWIGPAAFLTCLWATRRYRSWAQRLAGPAFAPLAERFLMTVSSNRSRLAAAIGPTSCDDGTCHHRVGDAAGTRHGPHPMPGWPEQAPWRAPPAGRR